METVFYSLLIKQHPHKEREALKIGAVMLSWSIYGASKDCQHYSSLAAEQYIKKAIPYLIHGMAVL
jgi:hypothetical protein